MDHRDRRGNHQAWTALAGAVAIIGIISGFAHAESMNGCTTTYPLKTGGKTWCSYTATGPAHYSVAVAGSALYDIRVDGYIRATGRESATGCVTATPGQTVTVYVSCDHDNDNYCARPGVAVVSIGDE